MGIDVGVGIDDMYQKIVCGSASRSRYLYDMWGNGTCFEVKKHELAGLRL